MAENIGKKKKPIWARILIWLFSTILSLVLLLAAFCGYLYFRHQINVIDVIKQVKILNQDVNVDALAKNQYTDEDLTSAKDKIDNISTAENAVKLSDRELAAYVNDTVKNQEGGLPMTFGSSTINLIDYGFAIVQMEFSNIPEDNTSDKLTDFNIVLKIELKKFKQEKMGKFPLKWIANMVPNSLYFSCNLEITKTADGYETTNKYMTINNLSASQTTSIFKTFDTFTKIGTAEKFNKSLGDGFIKVLIGEDGLYDQLKVQGAATGYSFAKEGTTNNLVIYTADVDEKHSITYHDGTGTTIEFYDITDNTFAPKTPERAGYSFIGWYDGPGEDANKVETIDATKLEDIELYARWDIINYTISYNLDNGTVDGENPTTYNINSEEITLVNPTKDNYNFVGWTWEGQSTPTMLATIPAGSTGNRNFVAHFDAHTYTITYKDQDNLEFSGSFVGSCPTIHKYNEETILPTATKEGYTFNGWFDSADCTGDAITKIEANVAVAKTFYAKWTINSYTLTLKDGATTIFTVTQNYGTTINYDELETTKTGYTFIGWSAGLPGIMPAENKTIYANYQANTYTLTFDANGGVCGLENTEITYNHVYGTLPASTKTGYTFAGWYAEDTFETTVSENTVCRTTTDITIYAKYEIINYTITYSLNNGTVAGVNPTSYTVEDETFTLINPTKDGNEFLGWEGTGLSDVTLTVTITKGSTGNREYNAVYDGDEKTLTVIVDNKTVKLANFEYGQKINTTNLINPEEIGMTGYSVEKWYADPEMTEEFDSTQSYYDNVTIYGRWDYLVDKITFYPYISEFNILNAGDVLTIDTQDKLIAFFDYVRFFNVTKQIKLNITYANTSSSSVNNAIQAAHAQLMAISEFQTLSKVTSSLSQQGSKHYGYYYVSTDNVGKQAVKIMDPTKTYTYTQKDYALKTAYAATERHFKTENVSKTITVETTEQLVWALENGYKADCIADSKAEALYQKVKVVLSQICKDSMTDIEKLRAMYEWLILNVQYDNYAAAQSNTLTAAELKEYDSWYADGVFNSKVAVCEGIAKALVIMARTENIPAVMVVNNTHAWNKVYISGKWYGFDATHGNILDSSATDVDKTGGVKGIEVLSYNEFLFTDAYKENKGYTATNYTDFVADTEYNYYTNAQYTFNENNFDLQIDSQEELVLLLKKAKEVEDNMTTKHYLVEFTITPAYASNYNTWLSNAVSAAGIDVPLFYPAQIDSCGNSLYILIVEKDA